MNGATVETQVQTNMPDDAALAFAQEQTQAQVQAEPISSLAEGNTQTQETAAVQGTEQVEEKAPAREPGWMQGRMAKVREKAIRETEERMTAQFQTMLAPLYESMLERQADDLVREGEFRSKERALEYVRLKNGQPISAPTPAAEQAAAPARDAQGRFAKAAPEHSTEEPDDPISHARADLLARQAEKIKANRGLDVMQAFTNNPEYKDKVLSGEWDFYEIAEAMQKEAGNATGRVPPAPVRTANGMNLGKFDVASMSDAQFAKLQAALASGKVFDAMK